MKTRANRKKTLKRINSIILLVVLVILLAGIPLLFIGYQAQKSGMSIKEVIARTLHRTSVTNSLPGENMKDESVRGAKIDFLVPQPVGFAFTEPPRISNVAVNDLDDDGLPDIIVCDAKNNFVSWIRQAPRNHFNEIILDSGFIAPAHVQVVDYDQDGDKDLMVAVLGLLYPSNDKIGSVLILENDGRMNFRRHLILDKTARVSDVRAADIDGDGDMDLALAQFGYDDGAVRWLENLGNWNFKVHALLNLSGPINVEILDVDADGDQDIISLVSQEWEQIYCFINDGRQNFTQRVLWQSDNEDFGSSGIYIDDLNRDGKPDILYTNGDAFDYIPPKGKPWHGVQWLENKGNLQFEFHRICTFVGAFNVRPADIDRDGDTDLFVVSGFNLWEKPEAQSFIWLENTGNLQFIRHDIARSPTHIISLECGDFNDDGQMDFVTGGMHAYPPYDRMGRVTIWMNNGKLVNNNK